jgi:hypothetical protein
MTNRNSVHDLHEHLDVNDLAKIVFQRSDGPKSQTLRPNCRKSQTRSNISVIGRVQTPRQEGACLEEDVCSQMEGANIQVEGANLESKGAVFEAETRYQSVILLKMLFGMLNVAEYQVEGRHLDMST